MRVSAILICLGACTYTTPNVQQSDANGDASAPEDTMGDTALDAEAGRVTSGLVGFWTFDAASPLVDTSNYPAGNPQPVNLTPAGTVVFGASTVETASATAKLESAINPRLNADCITGGGVTLEAWVSPSSASQGALADQRVVVGLTSSSNSRNVSLLQVGDRWHARVRTNSDGNGAPDLTPPADQVIATMTHLVVVADATKRILYVNGDAQDTDAMPGPLTDWDTSYRLVLGNEFQQSRPWTGTFELVAVYDRGLDAAEVRRNFVAGPTP